MNSIMFGGVGVSGGRLSFRPPRAHRMSNSSLVVHVHGVKSHVH